MAKSPDAFRTISEVAEWLDVPAHVLRFWESRFTQIKPVKRAGGRRYYRPSDMELLGGIKRLLHDDGLTIRGVQKLLREEGVKQVAQLSPPLDGSGMGPDVRLVSPRGDNVVPLAPAAFRAGVDAPPDRWPFVDDAPEAVRSLTETPPPDAPKPRSVEITPPAGSAQDAPPEPGEAPHATTATDHASDAPAPREMPEPEDAPQPDAAPDDPPQEPAEIAATAPEPQSGPPSDASPAEPEAEPSPPPRPTPARVPLGAGILRPDPSLAKARPGILVRLDRLGAPHARTRDEVDVERLAHLLDRARDLARAMASVDD
ncbi:MerR family transcriptional regulator [Palleronia sediminis]|uniref:MerR family transcriptional regulator n=1 Tax=Palleronia sediminis TaxID=2547833 RepID=UPI001F107068|nr:MerR family transcriptional regulator [Palleronia sediminis]